MLDSNYSTRTPRDNKLLAGLPEGGWQRVAPSLRPVKLGPGDVIYEPDAAIDYVLFPTSAIVSLVSLLADGGSAELAVVGNDGVVGTALFMGGGTTPSRAVVQSGGWAYRLMAPALQREFCRGGELQHLLLRYAQALLTQIAQTAVCNRHHSIDQQLCRWLLLTLDRLPAAEIAMTQELIANMLGVRREGVTDAAGRLQRAGLIHYSRGHIHVLDRAQLEARCCECYAVVRRESDRLLPPHAGRAALAPAAHHAPRVGLYERADTASGIG